ncbi:hypothetical protein CRUP_015145 [Coryphaenoides rupestris]|nr:hypothetical protein CRUP_015145 [Coryphaenoides rupestris]
MVLCFTVVCLSPCPWFAQEKSRIDVYWRPLSHSSHALVFLSRRQDMPYSYQSSLAKLNFPAGTYEAHDVFSGTTVSGLNDTAEFKVSINPSGVVMWYVYPVTRSPGPHVDTGRYPYVRRKYRVSSAHKVPVL